MYGVWRSWERACFGSRRSLVRAQSPRPEFFIKTMRPLQILERKVEIIRKNPDNLPTPLAAYSQVVRAGNIITTAGFIATNQNGDLVGEGDIEKQTRQSIENMIKALESVDSTLENVIKVTVYLSDMNYYKQMNLVYNEYFEKIKPARATVEGKLVLPSLLFEIDAIAVC